MALASCVSDNDLTPVGKYGQINVNVNNDPAMVETRGIVSVADLSTWTIKLLNQAGTEVESGKGKTSFTVSKGTYKVYASNYASKADVYAANGTYGDAYYEGTSDEIALEAGDTEEAKIACGTAKNARIRAEFPATVISNCAIKLTHSTATSDADYRENGLTLSGSNLTAYYEPQAALTYVLSYTYAGNLITATAAAIQLGTAAQETVIIVKTNDNGTITVSVTKNDEFTNAGTTEITIDAATGEKVQ